MAVRKRLTGLNDYFYDGIPLNSEQKKVININWKPDFKRKLLIDVNIFTDWTDTAPYEMVEAAFKQAYDVKEPGRPRVLNEALTSKLKTPEYRKFTHKQAAEKLGVSVSTVKRERERLR